MKNHRRPLSALSLTLWLLSGCAVVNLTYLNKEYGSPDTAARSRFARQAKGVDFVTDVKPLLDRRCVVCHACYDAPCQLNLSSYEGVERGASKVRVYNTERLVEAPPTRLAVDARSAQEWRERSFHPVLNERTQTEEYNRAASVLAKMLELKKKHPLPQTAALPAEDYDFSLDRKQQCPAIEEFQQFAKKFPQWGMPYGFPGLTEDETKILTEWVAQGSPYADPPPLSSPHAERIAQWETFLNGNSPKEQLMSRYIYEHLFLAHFHFDDLPPGEFFELVRSKTPPGTPLDLVTTRRVYEDPGTQRVYYRLRRVESTIVSKRHLPYALNAKRMKRWHELFLTPTYTIAALPSYDTKTASNPFATFKDIPIRSRYEFMLDESQFTIMGFIKGPVCRGQVALNVINDQFWIVFVNPKVVYEDHKVAQFLADNNKYLELPAEVGSQALVATTWLRYSNLQKKYLEKKASFVKANWADPGKFTLNSFWDGGGTNPNSALTVFRHFDSASVVKGLVGDEPKTCTVMGYPLLERIHYLLVAGYDVFGNVGHQVSTRLYMDFLRMEAEAQFLSFLPKEARRKERDLWYQGAKESVKEYVYGMRSAFDNESGIPFKTDNPKAELYGMLKRHLAKAGDNRYDWAGVVKDPLVADPLRRLAGLKGIPVSLLPEMSILKVGNQGYFTLLRNSEHAHITGLLDQSKERLPDQDTLTVVNGFIGDYPEMFFEVQPARLSTFVDAVSRLNKETDYAALLNSYGIRRTDAQFWNISDKTQEANLKWAGVEAGLLDLNRYQNR